MLWNLAQRAALLRAATVPRTPKIHTDKAFLFQGLGSKDHRGLSNSDAVTPLWKFLESTPGGAGHFWPCYIQIVASHEQTISRLTRVCTYMFQMQILEDTI